MKREDYKLGAEGWVVDFSLYPYRPIIRKVTLESYAMSGGFIGKGKDGFVHIVRDSQDIFYTAKEACDWLEDACEKAIEEAVDAESEDT